MKILFLIFCTFSIVFPICNDNNLKKISKTKYNEENKKEFEEINKIIVDNLKNGIKKFDNKNLLYNVQLTIDENGEFCYYSIKKSDNEEYNKFIEKFIENENGKIYYENKIFKRISIDIKPF